MFGDFEDENSENAVDVLKESSYCCWRFYRLLIYRSDVLLLVNLRD